MPGQAEIRSAVETAFRQHYDQLGDALYNLLRSKDPQQRQMGQLLTSLEYENLVTALNLALVAQISILNYYRTLSNYLDVTQDQRRGLELGQIVLSLLEIYPAEKLSGPLGAEFAGVIDDIAIRQLALKEYAAAEAAYQKALAIWLENRSYDADTIKKGSASIYHQLGAVAQAQRRWMQSEQYYQQALQICIEYNDRYSQASTYHQLGRVAEEQWVQAREYFLRALKTYVDYNDTHDRNIVLHSLAKLWESAGDNDLPTAIAVILNATLEDTKALSNEMLDNQSGEPG